MSDLPHPRDKQSFNDALADVIHRAYQNGTDPEGAWKCSIDGNENFHWDVQITRVEYED